MTKKQHEHYWYQAHVVYEGRSKNEVGVVRYCQCGLREMAFTKAWKKPPANYDIAKMTLEELERL